MKKYIYILLFSIIFSIFILKSNEKVIKKDAKFLGSTYEVVFREKKDIIEEQPKIIVDEPKDSAVINNNKNQKYKLTHYGPDCSGCSGLTASGFDAKQSIYYNDQTYGTVRIVAMSKSMPLYSVIKIKNYKFGGDIIAIVLDRGVGNGKIDLLVESESISNQYGIQNNVEIEILRKGK